MNAISYVRRMAALRPARLRARALASARASALTRALPLLPALAGAPAAAQDAEHTLARELSEGFYARVNVLAFGVYSDLSQIQRDLNFLGFSRSQLEVDVRPDFSLTFRDLDLGLKPRLLYARNRLDPRFGNDPGGTETRRRAYINEAYLRYRLNARLTAIVSRENLQWGPAGLLSPTNPFNPANGKGNPSLELPGMDYVRLVAVPSAQWTVSLIANVGAGRLNKDDQLWPTVWTVFPGIPRLVPPIGIDYGGLLRDPFRKTYAVKADYTGEGYYWSVLASHREQGGNRVGLFGGWNLSEAALLYAEGAVERKPDQPPSEEDTRRLLAGASYTLESGATVSAEYFYNNQGCTLRPIALCAIVPGQAPRLPLLRRRYLLLQYVDPRMFGRTSVIVRAIRNLDDSSLLYALNLEWELGEHSQIFLSPTVVSGREGSEFAVLPRRTILFGLSYTF